MEPRCCIKSTELNDFQLKIFDANRQIISCFKNDNCTGRLEGNTPPLPSPIRPFSPSFCSHITARLVMTYNINFTSTAQICNYSVIIYIFGLFLR